MVTRYDASNVLLLLQHSWYRWKQGCSCIQLYTSILSICNRIHIRNCNRVFVLKPIELKVSSSSRTMTCIVLYPVYLKGMMSYKFNLKSEMIIEHYQFTLCVCMCGCVGVWEVVYKRRWIYYTFVLFQVLNTVWAMNHNKLELYYVVGHHVYDL